MSEKKPEMHRPADSSYAFPWAVNIKNGIDVYHAMHPGMTLRDYFAAKAMQVLIEKYDGQDDCIDEIPAGAYEWADAMLRAREAKL